MAFPSIEDQVSTFRSTAETTSPIALPTPAASGDLLLVFVRAAAAGAVGWPAGWTELFESSDDASDDVTAVAYRKADGSEGATIDVTHGSAAAAAFAYRISGAADPAVRAPEASAAAIGSGTNPDPPLLTPTGGAKDYLWLALCAHEGPSGITSGGYPSDFPDHRASQSSGAVGADRCVVRTAALQANAASRDPGTYTLTLSVLWSAWTLAIHPSDALTAPVAGLALDAPGAGLVLLRQEIEAAPAEIEFAAPQALLPSSDLIPAGQMALAASGSTAPVLLVHLTTYSDVVAETVDTEYWWTQGADILYPWAGGAVRTFEGALLRVGELTRAMAHLPSDTVLDTRRTVLDLTVANEASAAGGTRWSELRTKNLLYSKIELAVLLITPSRRLGGTPAAWDLRDLGGAEHVVWFRGECTHVGPVTATDIPMTFETVEPQIDWPRCLEAGEADPRHLGARYPIPIGQAKNVPLLNRKVGWVTTLAEAIETSAYTGQVKVTDATGLPDAGSFLLQIGAERVTASRVDLQTINVSARGQQSSVAIAHKASEQVIEILTESAFVFSGVEAQALDALYVISPLTGERVKILTSFQVDLADATLDSGRVLGVVRFDQAQFAAMIDAMLAVSQQPTLEAGGVTDSIAFQTFAISEPNPDNPHIEYAGFDWQTDAALASAPTRLQMLAATGTDNGPNDESWKVWWSSAAGFPNPTKQVTRFRFNLTFSGFGGPGGSAAVRQPLRLVMRYQSIYGRTGTQTLYIFDNGVTENNVTFQSGWITANNSPLQGSGLVDPAGNSSFVRFWVELVTTPSGGLTSGLFAQMEFDSCEIETELEPASLTGIGVAAISLGWGLDFVADVKGAMDGVGALAESGPAAVAWFLSTLAGLGPDVVDGESFQTAEARLGSNVLAGDLRLLGEGFAEVLAGLGFHTRSNIVAREGPLYTVYRMLAAQADNSFGAPVRELTEIRNQTESRREAQEAVTRFLGHYRIGQIAPGAATIREADARDLVRIDADQNDASSKVDTADLEAAEARWGRRDSEPVMFPLIDNENTARDVLGYYAFEAVGDRGRFSGTIPFDDGYILEIGDVVELTPRGAGGTITGRVVQLSLVHTEPHIGLIAEEVT